MSEEIENKLNTIPVIKQLVALGKTIKPTSLEGLSVYDILELYVIGIFKGAFSYRASAVAFSFFMALFPFALFLLNLIAIWFKGDKEKELGLPFSPLCDRNNTPIAQSQIGFINFIVEPSMAVMGDMIDKIFEQILSDEQSRGSKSDLTDSSSDM